MASSSVRTSAGVRPSIRSTLPEVVSAYQAAVAVEDFEAAAILIGESIGLIHAVRPAADIVAEMAAEADRILNR
jgi:nitronate monooxygenase